MTTKSLCIPLISAVFLSAGCVTTDLSSEGKKVKVIRGDVLDSCSEIGSKTAVSGSGAQAAKNMLRNWAAIQGANQITFDTIETSGANTSMTATAFKCP